MLQNQQQSNIRNSSIELLRIIAMILIVFYHFAVHGEFQWGASSISIPRLWYNFIAMGGRIGVDVFVMISGYHLISDMGRILNLQKILKYVGQVFFYSVAFFIVQILAGADNTGIKSFIKACFPITFSQWWFASTYFVLYLFHPFLNKLLHCMDRVLYQKFLLFLVICWSIIPTFTTSSYQSNPLLWFVTLYSIAGYIRLYGLHSKFTDRWYFAVLLICSLLTYASSVIFSLLGRKWSFLASHTTYFYGQEKITTLLMSLCLFRIFAAMKMNYHRWINVVASATFGVYLIHDSSFVRQFLWLDLFRNAQYQESIFLIPYSIIVVTVVYTVCTLIDLLRQQIIEKPFMIMINHYSEAIIRPFEIVVSVVIDFLFGKQN